MNEIANFDSAECMERHKYLRDDVPAQLAGVLGNLERSWCALEAQAAEPGADKDAVAAEVHRLLAAHLTVQRVLTWAMPKPMPNPPAWVVEDGHVVVGDVRVPLSVDLISEWMKGEAA